RRNSAQGDQGRLTSVRAELLPALPPRRPASRGNRHLDFAHRLSLRCAQQWRQLVARLTWPMPREQRLVFGEGAERYDLARPSYPDALIDDLIATAGVDGRGTALEVGTGTGKATAMFAARGISVLGIEPSAEMAAVARRNLAAYTNVAIERSDFETWDPAGRTFPLVFSAQAWHWVSPSVGYARAAAVLEPRGLLAAFWN